jgi:hypothetical protein
VLSDWINPGKLIQAALAQFKGGMQARSSFDQIQQTLRQSDYESAALTN